MLCLPGMGMHGSVLEDQLNRLKEYENAVVSNKAIMEEMEKIHQAVQEAMIFENRLASFWSLHTFCQFHFFLSRHSHELFRV